jgi:hypothetical protein
VEKFFGLGKTDTALSFASWSSLAVLDVFVAEANEIEFSISVKTQALSEFSMN